MTRKQLEELIKETILEMSITGGGTAGASFTPGTGEQYATPYAFNPNKKAKGTSRNYYTKKLGWKEVTPGKIKGAKGIIHKDLWK